MSLTSLKTWPEFLRLGSSDTSLWMDSGGAIQATPANLFENAFATEFGEDGEPESWDLDFDVAEIVAYHYNLSRPGAKNRVEQLAQQTTAPRPLSESSYVHHGAWVPGGQPEATSKIRPGRPELEVASNGSRGLGPGTFGVALGWSSAFGPAGVGGYAYVTLAAGEYPRVPRPDGIPSWATTLDIAITRKDKGPDTAVYIRKIPVERLIEDMIPIPGPWSARHGRVSTSNRSGVPRAVAPRSKDTGTMTSDFPTMAGHWTPLVQYWLPALPGSGNTPRTNLVGVAGKPIKIKGDRYRVKVAGPAPANVQAADAMPSERLDNVDPRDVRPSGKHPDNEYLGQEVDFQESRLVSLINAERSRLGLPVLVLNASLNRAAENGTDPDAEGYQRRVNCFLAAGDAEDVFSHILTHPEATEGDFEAVGVARLEQDNGWKWRVWFGDDPELPEDEPRYCDEFLVEHVTEDGAVYSKEVEYADARLSFNLVSNNSLGWTYNGSYAEAVEHASAAWNRLSAVNVSRGGNQIAITDGSLGGPMARTYSDGRIIFDSGIMSGATKNARRAAAAHEFGHALGFDHVTVASVLNTPIYTARTTNHEVPTSYDVQEYRAVYGAGSGGSGGGSSEPPEGYGNEIRKPKEEEETEEPQFHYEWRTSPFKEKTALYFRLPKMVRRNLKALKDLRCTYWWLHESTTGVLTTYRAYDSKQGPSSYFDSSYGKEGPFDGRIECPGLSPDAPQANKKGRGPRVRLIQEDFPTEDTTPIESPDPSSAPDEIEKAGFEVLGAGRFAATVQGVLKDGGLTEQSFPGRDANQRPFVEITGTQTVKVVPQTSVNLLKNAEGTQLNGQGLPEDVLIENAGVGDAGYVTPEDGTWKIGTRASTNASPRALFRAIPVGSETVLSVAGTVGATRVTSTSIRFALRQLDENRLPVRDASNNVIPDLVVTDLASAGETVFSQRYGTHGTPFDPQTAYAQFIIRLGGTTLNADGYFQHLRVYPFQADIGKVEEGSGEEPASFNPTPDTPSPSGSFALVGPAPEPPGGTSQAAPPLALVDFENGLIPGGWTLEGTAPDSGVQAGAAIFGGFGFRCRDNLTTGAHGKWIQRQFPELTGTGSALRMVWRFDQLPTSGAVAFQPLTGSGGSVLAYLRVGPAGNLAITVNANGRQPITYPLNVTVYTGTKADIELSFVPGKQGIVTVAVGLGGRQREIVFQRNFDFFERNGDLIRAGATFSFDAKTRYSFAFDNVAVTPRGDVLDRERPAPPVGVSIPPEDRPARTYAAWTPKTAIAANNEHVPTARNEHYYTGSAGVTGPNEPSWPLFGTARDNAGLVAVARSTAYALGASVLKPSGTSADAEWYEVTTAGTTAAVAPTYPTTGTVTDGAAVLTARTTVVWTESGSVRRVFDPSPELRRINQLRVFLQPGEGLKTIPVLEDPINVRPGLSYCFGAFMRYSVFFESAPGLRVWLESDDKDLPPRLAASIGMTGERGWHPSLELDDYAIVDVPAAVGDSPGYTRARIELAVTPGFYVMQEFLFAQESATFTRAQMATFANRDAMRSYARALSGTGEWILPLLQDNPDLGPQFGAFLSEVGVKSVEAEDASGNPVGSLTASFSTTTDGITFAPYTSPDSQAMRYMRFSVSLSTNGTDGPEIPAGGIFARTWSPMGTLTREDGTPFPGGAFASPNLWLSSYPDTEDRRVGGRLSPVVLSEVIDRLAKGFRVGVTTEDAIEEIEYLSRIGLLRAEIPGLGNSVAGTGLLLRCEGGVTFEGAGVPPRIAEEFKLPRRVLHAVGECGYAEVLQSGPLQPPMGPPISQRQLELSPAAGGA